jgi:hypothetical protein
MTHLRRSLWAASVVFALAAAGSLQATAPAGTDLWGGPAAKGVGTNARFDTNGCGPSFAEFRATVN